VFYLYGRSDAGDFGEQDKARGGRSLVDGSDEGQVRARGLECGKVDLGSAF